MQLLINLNFIDGTDKLSLKLEMDEKVYPVIFWAMQLIGYKLSVH